MSDDSLREAKRIKRNYSRRLKRLRIKATCGDKKAARDLMVLLTEKIVKLKELGYRLTDETEDGRINRLVLITQEWIEEQNNKQTDLDRLRVKARNGSDEDQRAFTISLGKSLED